MSEERERFDPTDYSVVVKLRGNPPKPWRWEIYRAGRWGPVESSQVLFESAAEAAKEGKKALARLLAKAAEGPRARSMEIDMERGPSAG